MNDKNVINEKGSFLAILPLIGFVVIFMGSGIVLTMQGVESAFRVFPSHIAAFYAMLLSMLLGKGKFGEKFSVAISGMSDMSFVVAILVLAGAFSTVTTSVGSVDSVIGLSLTYIPADLIAPGFFVIGCIISFVSGSSMGTVFALGPIAMALASEAGINAGVMAGVLFSCATFGNSTSPVSDCTIVATQMFDIKTGKGINGKLKSHLMIVAPALLLSVIFFTIVGRASIPVAAGSYDFNLILILPYICVILTALSGMHIILSLGSGVLVAVILGIGNGTYDFVTASQDISAGMNGMVSILLLTLFMGGLMAVIKKHGGMQWVIYNLQKLMKGSKSAQIWALVLGVLTPCFIPADSLPIFALGSIYKDLCKKFKIDPRKMASMLECTSTNTVSLLPYSPMNLIVWGLAAEAGLLGSWADGVFMTFTPWLSFIFFAVFTFVPLVDKSLAKDPWDYENWCPSSESEAVKNAQKQSV